VPVAQGAYVTLVTFKRKGLTYSKTNVSIYTMTKLDRTQTMINLFKLGNTLQEVGDKYHITRERVRQILTQSEVKAEDGGRRIKKINRCFAKKEKWLNTWLPLYKCLRKDFIEITQGNGVHGGNKYPLRYWRQATNSKSRGIGFNLTFPEWYKIWEESGHIGNMGLGVGKYCMSRYKDVGNYEIGNVKIISSVQNSVDAWKYKKWKVGPDRKDFCIRGHNLNDLHNVLYTKNGHRYCSACRRIFDRKKYIERKPLTSAEKPITI